MNKRWYRIDVTATNHLGYDRFDEMYYIEERVDKNDKVYYVLVEDYGNKKIARRFPKYMVENRIQSGRYKEWIKEAR